MTTIVYKEVLQSCHESHSQVLEPMTLSLKVTNPSKPTSSTVNTNFKAWSAIEALSLSSPTSNDKEKETVYVHPLAKRSLSGFSDKSLEMCTESLGSETGAFITETTFFSSPSPSTSYHFHDNNNTNNSNDIIITEKKGRKGCQDSIMKMKEYHVNITKSSSTKKFPPPLTTMRGSNPMHIRSCREDGRLVIEAVSAPPTHPCLKAERSDGRLKLSLVRDWGSDNDDVDEVEWGSVENGGEVVEEEEEGEEKGLEERRGKECVGKFFQTECEDMIGIKFELGGKVGMKELHQWRTRCKASGGRGNHRRLINWEPFWVAA